MIFTILKLSELSCSSFALLLTAWQITLHLSNMQQHMHLALASVSGLLFYICWLSFRALSHLYACTPQELITKTCQECHSKDGNGWMGRPSKQIIGHIAMRKLSQRKSFLWRFCMNFPLIKFPFNAIFSYHFQIFCVFSCNIPSLTFSFKHQVLWSSHNIWTSLSHHCFKEAILN